MAAIYLQIQPNSAHMWAFEYFIRQSNETQKLRHQSIDDKRLRLTAQWSMDHCSIALRWRLIVASFQRWHCNMYQNLNEPLPKPSKPQLIKMHPKFFIDTHLQSRKCVSSQRTYKLMPNEMSFCLCNKVYLTNETFHFIFYHKFFMKTTRLMLNQLNVRQLN